jgi:hypothetical protein
LQGTVRSYDPVTQAGSVFLDDGTVREFSGSAFAASGLRLLRPGQRVALRWRPGGEITALSLITFPLPGEDGADPSARAPGPRPEQAP